MARRARPPSNRRVVVIGAVGLVLIAAFFVWSRSQGSGDGAGSEAPATTTTTAATPGPAPTGGVEPPDAEPEVPGGSFEVFSTRDPFEPPIDLTPAPAPTPSPTAPAPGPTTPAPTAPAPGPAPAPGVAVALLEVFEQDGALRARVQVGSTVYTVGPGDTFATSFRVVSLAGTCGQFLYGDSPFQLCEGEQVIK